MRPPRILIVGWYGFGNAGDEAILSAIAGDLRGEIQGCELAVMSGDPEHTARTHAVRAYPLLPYHYPDIRRTLTDGRLGESLTAFRWSDLVVFGGGGFFSDWQPEAIPTWLSKAVLARLLGKPVMLYAIGAGPVRTARGKCLTRWFVDRIADAVTVRDDESLRWLESAGVRRAISVTADPAIGWLGDAAALKGRAGRRRRPIVAISVAPLFHVRRLWPGGEEKHRRYKYALVRLVDRLTEEMGAHVSLVCMQPSYDGWFAAEVRNATRRPVDCSVVAPEGGPAVVQSCLGQADLVVGMRLHSLVLAASAGVPVVAICYHHKVFEFMRMLGQERYATTGVGDGTNWATQELDADELFRQVTSLWPQRRRVGQDVRAACLHLRGLARQNATAAAVLLRRTRLSRSRAGKDCMTAIDEAARDDGGFQWRRGGFRS